MRARTLFTLFMCTIRVFTWNDCKEQKTKMFRSRTFSRSIKSFTMKSQSKSLKHSCGGLASNSFGRFSVSKTNFSSFIPATSTVPSLSPITMSGMLSSTSLSSAATKATTSLAEGVEAGEGESDETKLRSRSKKQQIPKTSVYYISVI